MTVPVSAFGRIRQPCDGKPPQEHTTYLEQSLWNNQNIARTESDIAVDVAISDQAVEMDRIGILLPLGRTDGHGGVPRRKPGQTANCDHRIEHRHVRTIWKGAGLRSFTVHADLIGDRTDEAFHDEPET